MADLGKSNISWSDCIIVIILFIVAYLLYSHSQQVDALDNINTKLSNIQELLKEPIETEFNIK